jgi:hypothetical protein
MASSLASWFEIKTNTETKRITKDGINTLETINEKSVVVKGTNVNMKLRLKETWLAIPLHSSALNAFVDEENTHPPHQLLTSIVAETWLYHFAKGSFHTDDQFSEFHEDFSSEDNQIKCVVESVQRYLFSSNKLSSSGRLLCVVCEFQELDELDDVNLMEWTVNQWISYCSDLLKQTFQPLQYGILGNLTSKLYNFTKYFTYYYNGTWANNYKDWRISETDNMGTKYFTYLTFYHPLHKLRINGQFEDIEVDMMQEYISCHPCIKGLNSKKKLKDLYQSFGEKSPPIVAKLILFSIEQLSWKTLTSVTLESLHDLIQYLVKHMIEGDWCIKYLQTESTAVYANAQSAEFNKETLDTLVTHFEIEKNVPISQIELDDPLVKDRLRLQHMICSLFDSNRLSLQDNMITYAVRVLFPASSVVKWKNETFVTFVDRFQECVYHLNERMMDAKLTRFSLNVLRDASREGINIVSNWKHINEFEDYITNESTDFFAQIEANIAIIQTHKLRYFREHLEHELTDENIDRDKARSGSLGDVSSSLLFRKKRIQKLIAHYETSPPVRNIKRVILDSIDAFKKEYLEFPSRHPVMLKFLSWICELGYTDYRLVTDAKEFHKLPFIAPQSGKEKGANYQDWDRNMIVVGSPGCGKTTFITFVRSILIKLGLVYGDGLAEADIQKPPYQAGDLVSGVSGQSAIAAARSVADRLDDVYFLDEAYQLIQKMDSHNSSGYSREAYERLLNEISDWSWCTLFILVGYKEDMKGFKSNEGYIRRMNTESAVELKDYTLSEMAIIFRNHVMKLLSSPGTQTSDLVVLIDKVSIEAEFAKLFKSHIFKQGVTAVTKYATAVVNRILIIRRSVAKSAKNNDHQITAQMISIMRQEFANISQIDQESVKEIKEREQVKERLTAAEQKP